MTFSNALILTLQRVLSMVKMLLKSSHLLTHRKPSTVLIYRANPTRSIRTKPSHLPTHRKSSQVLNYRAPSKLKQNLTHKSLRGNMFVFQTWNAFMVVSQVDLSIILYSAERQGSFSGNCHPTSMISNLAKLVCEGGITAALILGYSLQQKQRNSLWKFHILISYGIGILSLPRECEIFKISRMFSHRISEITSSII